MPEASQDNFSYKDRIVGFLDILGFKETVLRRGEDVPEVIQFIDKNLNRVLDGMRANAGDWYSAKLFSDCICISCENSTGNLYNMLNELSYFQLSLAIEGIFIRGALTFGPHYENERIIFSEALINAYELEKVAIYPRIIVSQSILDLIESMPENDRKGSKSFLMNSPDGVCCLDYFQHLYVIWEEHGIDVIDFLTDHRDSIVRQVERYKHNARVLEKYKWVAEYHNFKVPHFYNPEDYPEERELISEMMVPITIFPSYNRYE
jgi:hypothetical protein